MAFPTLGESFHGPDFGSRDRLDKFLTFADELLAWFRELVEKEADRVEPLEPISEDFLNEFREALIFEREAMSDARSAVREVPEEILTSHRLWGALLTFKTRIIDGLTRAIDTGADTLSKAVDAAKRLIDPVSSLLGSIFSACGMTIPQEFWDGLKALFDLLGKGKSNKP